MQGSDCISSIHRSQMSPGKMTHGAVNEEQLPRSNKTCHAGDGR